MAEVTVRPKRGAGGSAAPFFIVYLRQVIDELRKVVWPTPQELYRYTIVVVATVVVIGLFIGAVDAGLQVFAQRVIYNAVTK